MRAVVPRKPSHTAHGIQQKDIGLLQIYSFAGIIGPLAIGSIGLTAITPYYTLIFGLPLAAVGLLMTCGRIYDVFADITIAFISDNTRSRFGKRKLWIVIGLITYLPAAWLLFMPQQSTTLHRLALALFLFFTTWTIAYIPALTQASELSPNFDTRSKVSMSQGLVTQGAIIAGVMLPFLLIDPRNAKLQKGVTDFFDWLNFPVFAPIVRFLHLPVAHGGEIFHRNVLIVMGFIAVITPIALIFYMRFVPAKPAGPVVRKASITAALRNRLFHRFAIGYFFIMCGYMGRTGLGVFVIMQGLKLPDSYLFLMMAQQVVATLITPFWTFLLRRFERVTCVALAAICEIVGISFLMVIPAGNEHLALIAMILMGLPGQAIMLVPYLIAGDCSDYAKWKTGKESRAVHVSLVSTMVKIGAIASAILVALAGALGFHPQDTAPTDHAIFILKLTALGIPAALMAIGTVLIWRFPLTRRRHAAIQSRIARRSRDAATIEALPITAL